MSALPPKADTLSAIVNRKLGNGADTLFFDWIGLGKGNGGVQAYLAYDHWRDSDTKMVVHSWESQWTKLRHSPLATRYIMCGS